MKNAFALLILFASLFCVADSSENPKRDAALKAINACSQRKRYGGACRHLDDNIQALVEVYRHDDKTVLPILFRFTYLTEFYDEALLNDPSGFLAMVSELPDESQQAVVKGIAGNMFGLRSKESFDAVRAVLIGIDGSLPIKTTAQLCLKTLERVNAQFLRTYFPPGTFTSRGATLQYHGYSSEMYALGEQPLWHLPPKPEAIYRLTYVPPFTGPTVITLFVSSDGVSTVTIKSVGLDRETTTVDESREVSADQLTRFSELIEHAHFWAMPTELPPQRDRLCLDAAGWIMEGVKDNQYRVVFRGCPDVKRQSIEEAAFVTAGYLLFELAGDKQFRGR